jgi:hypothetical protein
MSDFIDNDDHQGSGGGNGGEFCFDDLEANAELAKIIAASEEPEIRPPDKVRRERLMGGVEATFCSSFGRAKKIDPDVSADIDPTLFNPIDRDPDLEKAMEESRLLYEVEGNLRGDADLNQDLDYEKAIAESIEAQILHEEEITKAAVEEERTKRSAECDLPLRRLKMMFGRKPDLLARVDALFRGYMECATGPYLYLSSEDHLFFGDLMDYLYTLPSKLMGRSILSKDVYERLTKYMVIRDAEITPEDQFFMRSQWAEGMSDEALRQRWAILKSIFE